MNLGPMADALEAVTLEPKDGQLEAGIASTAQGRARWCQHCDTTRLATDMRWTLDGVYACRWCLGPGVGTPELWTDPTLYETGAVLPIFVSTPSSSGVITKGGFDWSQPFKNDPDWGMSWEA